MYTYKINSWWAALLWITPSSNGFSNSNSVSIFYAEFEFWSSTIFSKRFWHRGLKNKHYSRTHVESCNLQELVYNSNNSKGATNRKPEYDSGNTTWEHLTSSPFLIITPMPSGSYMRSSGGIECNSLVFGLFVLSSGSMKSCQEQTQTPFSRKTTCYC